MDFIPGSYAQIKIPAFTMDYDKDIDKSLIGDEYLPSWEKFGLFPLKCVNPEPTIRAYSMANYPAEGDVFMLTVRIATPPFKPDKSGFMDVNPGIASSYIFSLKPGDKVTMSGPFGDFHPHFDSKREMIWVGGGAGMAPLRAQIMHMTKTLHTTDREMHYFYGARALNEVFYLDDFLGLEKEYPNFHFHLALDRPDPAADAAGVKYTLGFVHQVMYNTYLKDHEAPEDVEYYMCGPARCRTPSCRCSMVLAWSPRVSCMITSAVNAPLVFNRKEDVLKLGRILFLFEWMILWPSTDDTLKSVG